jgi:hypothetical protein
MNKYMLWVIIWAIFSSNISYGYILHECVYLDYLIQETWVSYSCFWLFWEIALNQDDSFEISWADSSSFTRISNTYARDKNTIYFLGKPSKIDTSETISIITGSNYIKSNTHIYYNDLVVSWVSVQDLRHY